MVQVKNKFEKDILKYTLLIVGIVIACRFSKGLFAFGMAGIACYWALGGQGGKALVCYVLFPFFAVMNPGLLPKTGYLGLAIRLGAAAMSMAFMFAATQRRSVHSLPFGFMFAYLVAALCSSIEGYCPPISYMKVLNFAIFLVGIWLCTKNIYRRSSEMYSVRCFLLAISAVLVWGSYLTLLSPGIAYPQTVDQYIQWGGMSRAEAVKMAVYAGAESFLAGVLNHSNALAPTLACTFGFLLCDMLFVERRITRFHGATLVAVLPLLFLTRSRGALVSFLAAVMLVLMIGTKAIPTPLKIKARARSVISILLFFAFLGAVYLEVSGQRFSKYVRKTQNVSQDQRSLGEALTSSRMFLVSENMADFWRNPMLGMGFQTCQEHAIAYRAGLTSIFSAPIEKGVLPTMILGETGIVGGIAFILWLLVFVSVTLRRKYICTLCLMGVMLCTNMGEASFFSPGGVGGMLWIMTVVGGFVTDLQVLRLRDSERASLQRTRTWLR